MRLLGKQILSSSAAGASTALLWRVLAVLVIGAMLAKWTWVVFAPRSPSVLPAVPPSSSGLQAERLFGVAAASSVTVATAMPNARLVGVFAGTPGFAIIELDGKRQVGIATGKEIVAGAKLVEVAMDHVVIERGGMRQQLPLEGKSSAIKSAAAALVQTVPQPAAVATPVASAASPPTVHTTADPNVNAATKNWQETQQRLMRDRGGF